MKPGMPFSSFRQLAFMLQGVPYRIPGFRAELFDTFENLFHVRTVGVGLIRAQFGLFGIVAQGCPLFEVGFMHHAERADDGHGKLPHLQPCGHGGELPLESQVEQGGVQDVILMVSEGNLVAMQFLGHGEKHLAAVP